MDGEQTSMLSRAFLVAALLILPACATNSEMEALRTHVNDSLRHTRQQMQSRLSTLEDVKKRMEEQEKQLTGVLNAKQAQENRLEDLQLAVNRALEQQLLLREEVAKVRMTLQGKDDRFLLFLDAQENLYQDGLRTLHAIRGELSGKQNQTSLPRSEAAESSGASSPQSDSIEKNDLSRPRAR